MTFQIHALDPAPFAHLFDIPEEDLAQHRARRMVVTETPGTPCRATLDDAEIGETVILANYTHLKANSPFDASHAVFFRKNQPKVELAPGELPPAFLRRTISARAIDADGIIRDASLVDGQAIAEVIDNFLADPDIAEVHLHYAAPGCFAARATRA